MGNKGNGQTTISHSKYTCRQWIFFVNLLQRRHDKRERVSNHRRLNCSLNRLFRRRSNEASKLRVTGLCEGNSPVTGEFPAQKVSNAETVSIWLHHVLDLTTYFSTTVRNLGMESQERVLISAWIAIIFYFGLEDKRWIVLPEIIWAPYQLCVMFKIHYSKILCSHVSFLYLRWFLVAWVVGINHMVPSHKINGSEHP